MNDLTRKLRGLREHVGIISQKDLAALSGVGEKTISSFETGERIDSIKLSQLLRILAVYDMSAAEFFAWDLNPEPVAAPERRPRTERAYA
jgi:transcriptional regulator with XRE-family HTH domain